MVREPTRPNIWFAWCMTHWNRRLGLILLWNVGVKKDIKKWSSVCSVEEFDTLRVQWKSNGFILADCILISSLWCLGVSINLFLCGLNSFPVWLLFSQAFFFFGKITLPSYSQPRSNFSRGDSSFNRLESWRRDLSVTRRVFRHRLVHVLDIHVLREPRRASDHHRRGTLLHWGEHWRERQAHGSVWGETMPSWQEAALVWDDKK